MAFQYRNRDGKVEPKKLRACRKEVLADTEMSAADKARWLSRFDSIELSRNSAHEGQLVSMSTDDGVAIDMLGDIGEGFFSEGITAQSIARQIDGVKGVIKIRMNSRGGSAFEGDAIGSLLAASPARVEVDVLGISASAASIIAMSADEIRMAENAVMMIHEAWTSTSGGVREHEASAQLLRVINDGASQVYARRSGKSPEEMRALMSKETWFTAQQAVEIGLADRVIPGKSISQAWDPDDLPASVQAHLQLNSRDIQSDMRTIALRLGLPESSSEAEVLAVLDLKLKELKAQDESQATEAAAQALAAAETAAAVQALQAASNKEVQEAAAQLHQAACAVAVERYMAEGKVTPSMRDLAIKACGLTAETLSAQCALWEQSPSLVNRAAVPSKLPAVKAATLSPQQKKLARMAKITDEQFLAEQNGDR